MMRLFLAFALAAAAAAAPASAQEGNQTNVTDTPTTVVAGPDTSLNNVAQPALPVADEATAVQEVPADTVAMPATQPRREDDKGFPWGVIGLIGLIGLLGRVRS